MPTTITIIEGTHILKIIFVLFFFNDTATTEIYTLSLHDALPISYTRGKERSRTSDSVMAEARQMADLRSEEHTSELQSHSDLVCRLLLEKKKMSMCAT